MKILLSRFRNHRLRILSGAGAMGVFLGVLLSTFAPYLSSMASAVSDSPNNVNLTARTPEFPNNLTAPNHPLHACKGTFDNTVTKDANLLKGEFAPYLDNMTRFSSKDQLKHYNNGLINTYVGPFNLINNATDLDQVWALLQNLGSEKMSVIQFGDGDLGAGAVNGPPQQAGGNICAGVRMIRISADEWRGWQGSVGGPGGNSFPGINGRALWMRFKMDGGQSGPNSGGTLCYHDLTPGSQNPYGNDNPTAPDGLGNSCTHFVMVGTPGGSTDPGGGNVSVGFQGDWLDAAHIRITGGAQSEVGEIYQKFSWDAETVNGAPDWSVYFLAQATGDRTNMTWSTGNGCDNPITQTSGANGAPAATCANHNGGSGNCVPFIAVHQAINLSHRNGSSGPIDVGGFNNRVGALGGADATLYDYKADCTYLGKSSPTKLGQQNYARIWFYYSESNDQMATVFTSGAGNESQYIGRPAYVKFGANSYQGGANGCDGQVQLQQLSAGQSPETLRAAPWNMTDGKCATLTSWGTAQVLAIGGTAGEQGFNNTTGTIGAGITTPDTEPPKIGCDFFTLNPLNWIVCPFIKAATALVGELDNQINSLLTVDTHAIFDDSTPTGKAYHQSWAVFRTFALVVIAIASLVMVIAQAAGLDFLDAYTIKKILPRLIIAAIGIALSWDLMNLACQVSNDLGTGIRTIIYAPFGSLTGPLTQLDNSTKFSLILLGTGGILAFGWVALLSLVVTALLACLIGFALLVFRRVLITFLVLMAPLAIACSIMPNTQKVFKVWRESFFGALAVYVIIMAFIAAGRVFSVTALSNNADQAVSQIIAILAYFAPYFLIPAAFRLAGGFVATVGGIVNDRSRGAFDRLKNFRSNQVKKNMSEMAAGNRLQDKGLGKVFNRTTRGINATGKALGSRGFGALRPSAMRSAFGESSDQIARQQEEAFKKSQNFQLISEDDDALRAGTYGSRAAAVQAMTARAIAGGASQEDARKNATRAADAWGNATGNRWGGGYAIAAAKSMADTGTAYSNFTDAAGNVHTALEDAAQTIARVSGGRSSTIASAAGYINAVSAGKGRQDLHPSFGVLNALANMEAGNQVSSDFLEANNLTANGGARNYQTAAMKAFDGADPVSIVRQRAAGFQKSMDSLSAGYTQAVQDGDFQAARQYEARLQEVKSSLSYGAKENSVYFDETVRELEQTRELMESTPAQTFARDPQGNFTTTVVNATRRQVVADPTAVATLGGNQVGQRTYIPLQGAPVVTPDQSVPAGQRIMEREVSQYDIAQGEVRRPYDVNNPNAPS